MDFRPSLEHSGMIILACLLEIELIEHFCEHTEKSMTVGSAGRPVAAIVTSYPPLVPPEFVVTELKASMVVMAVTLGSKGR